MIQANELRVRNLVHTFSKQSEACPVREIKYNHARISYILDERDRTACVDYDCLLPIPLTEEWLLKFGFKKANIRPHDDYDYENNYEFEGVDLCGYSPYTKGDLIIGTREGSNGYFLIYEGIDGSENYCLFSFTGFEIISVHQLQNLYFALTGEELTIIK